MAGDFCCQGNQGYAREIFKDQFSQGYKKPKPDFRAQILWLAFCVC